MYILSHGYANLLLLIEITQEMCKYYPEMAEYLAIEVERAALIE